METTKQIEINSENLAIAKSRIQEMAISKKLDIVGEISTLVPVTYPSKSKMKEFRSALNKVISYPGMRNANIFLHKLSKLNGEDNAKIEYSEKEKAIKVARKEWRENVKKGWELRDKYKLEKGNFYKS
jgi:hypothetical protein